MHIPRLSSSLALVLLATMLAACTNPSASSPVTLTYAFPDTPAARASAEALHKGLSTAEPGMGLNLQPLPANSYSQALADQLKGNTPPDVFDLADVDTPALQSSGSLLDLTPYNLATGSINGAALKPWQVGGKLFGLPQHAVPRVLFYNRALFDAAHIPYPTDRWNWDDWRSAAKQLTNTAAGVYGTSVGNWTDLITANGGAVLNDTRTATGLDQPAAFNAVQFAADMINRDQSAPLPPAAGGPEPIQLFRAGKLAMLPALSDVIGQLQSAKPSFAWDVAPLPLRIERVTTLAVSGIAANAKTAHTKEAASFIAWATGRDGSAAHIQAFPFAVPTLPDVAPAGLLTAGTSGLTGGKFIIEALDYGRVPPYVPQTPQINKLVNESLKPVWQGKQSAEAAYKQVAPQINNLLQKG